MRVGGRLRYSSVTCSRQRRSCGIVSRFAVINRVTDSSNQRRTQDSRLAVSDRANSRIEYFDYDKKGPRLRASSQHTIWTGRFMIMSFLPARRRARERAPTGWSGLRRTVLLMGAQSANVTCVTVCGARVGPWCGRGVSAHGQTWSTWSADCSVFRRVCGRLATGNVLGRLASVL
jgi:hypothetical protein